MNSVIISDLEQWSEFVKFYNNNKSHFDIVAFDLETDGINESTAKIYGVGLAFDSDEAFYIPFKDKHGVPVFPFDPSEVINNILTSHKIIGHNIIYDMLVWYHNTGHYVVDHVHSDTILMKHALDEERPFGLKEVAVKYLGSWADKAQDALYENIKANGGSTTKTNLEMFKADTEVLGTYCCWDVMLTYKLFNLFNPMLEKEGLSKLFYHEEIMPLYKEVTIPMKKHGIKVDIPYFEKLLIEITEDINNLESKVMTALEHIVYDYQKLLLNTIAPSKKTGSFPRYLAGVLGEMLPDSLAKKHLDKCENLLTVRWMRGEDIKEETLLEAQLAMFFDKHPDQNFVFNLRSKLHLKYLFFQILKEEPVSFTDKDEPQVDDDFLESVNKKYSWVADLQDLNKLEKIKGTYIEGVLDRQIGSFIYTSMLQFGTTSGRYSSTNPNLQNLPRPKEDDAGLSEMVLKYTNAIRKGFVAPEGFKFVDADYSALEPRCFAHVSGSKDLQNIFHSGTDMYSAIAIEMFGLEGVSAFKKDSNFLGKIHPEKRQQVKAFCLAVVYGAESFRISDLLGIERAEAQKLIDMYLNAFPDLKRYIENCHYEVNHKGYVTTQFGRVRHLKEGQDLFKKHGFKLLDSRWAKTMGLGEERRRYKNLLNNSTNFKIQGLAAHTVNRAAIAIAREFKKHNIEGWVSLQIHDQIVCTVRQEQAEQARSIVRAVMENIVKLAVPLVAEPAIADNLKESH